VATEFRTLNPLLAFGQATTHALPLQFSVKRLGLRRTRGAGTDHDGRADRDGSTDSGEKHGLPFDRTVQRRGTHSGPVLINACGSRAIGLTPPFRDGRSIA
jgi:hypothetical protein